MIRLFHNYSTRYLLALLLQALIYFSPLFSVITTYVIYCAAIFALSVQTSAQWWEGGTVKSSVSTLRANDLLDLFTVKPCPADPSAL